MRRSVALLCLAVLLVGVATLAAAPLIELIVPISVAADSCGSAAIAQPLVIPPPLLLLVFTRHLPRASLAAAQR